MGPDVGPIYCGFVPPFPPQPPPAPQVRSRNADHVLPSEPVWSYPRPPEVRNESRLVVVTAGGMEIASSDRALRVCETAGAPVIYIPIVDTEPGALRVSGGRGSFCEWKGPASYFDVVAADDVIRRAAWHYPRPSPGFERIADHISFYPGLLECRLADELVRPQPGGFYGGWITDEITGPIKGEPGSEGW